MSAQPDSRSAILSLKMQIVGPANRRGVPWSGGLVPAKALAAAAAV